MDVSDARLIYIGIPGGEYDLLYQLLDDKHAVDRNVYKAFYYASSVFAASSKWELFGLTTVEYIAVRTPVVAYSVGGG